MKKIVLIVCAILFSSYLFAERALAYEDLPSNAKQFLDSYFSEKEIIWIEKEYDGYDVDLADDIEISFDKKGNWEEISGRYALPKGFIPADILTKVHELYPKSVILSIDKEYSYYDIELSNYRDIDIKADGTIISDKYDN